LAKGKDIFICLVPPVKSGKPVRPRPFLYMVLSGVLALFIGIFLAFLIEFIRKNRVKPTKE